MSDKLRKHSNGSHSLSTESGLKNIHKEVYNYIKALEKENEDLLEGKNDCHGRNIVLRKQLQKLKEYLGANKTHELLKQSK